MNDLHLLRPWFLLLFIPFVIFIYLLIRKKRQTHIWHKICDKELIPYILEQKNQSSLIPYLAIFATISLLIIGMTGPTWQQVPQPLIKTQSGLVIALDLSPFMNAEDIKPSRLKRALYKINDLLNTRKEGQTALLVFSGDSFIVTPLTDDSETIKVLLPALETGIMPSEGHRVHLAIEKASGLLNQAGIKNGHILLITSELANDDLNKSIEMATQKGNTISVLAVGAEASTPIPVATGGLMKNSSGALMMTSLAQKNLSQLAAATHGVYTTLRADDGDLQALVKSFSNLHGGSNQSETELKQNKWLDQGYLFVLAALPFVSLIFRRGMLCFVFFLLPHLLQAGLWQTKDQEAETLFHQQNYQEAEELFQNRDWKAAANYKLGNYETAAQEFKGNPSSDGFYNYGNAQVKMGDLKGAFESYDKALEIEPAHEDALFNKKLVEDYLKEQEKKEKKDDNKKNDDDQDSDQEEDQNQNQGGKENKQNKKNKEKEDQKNEKKKNEDQLDEQNEKEKGKSNDLKQGENKNQKQEKSDLGKEGQREQKNDTAPSEDDKELKNEKEVKDLGQKYRDEIEKEIQNNQEKQEHEQKSGVLNEDLPKEDPQRQVDNMWLQKVKDDPASLLRRKFLQQYQQKNNQKNGNSK